MRGRVNVVAGFCEARSAYKHWRHHFLCDIIIYECEELDDPLPSIPGHSRIAEKFDLIHVSISFLLFLRQLIESNLDGRCYTICICFSSQSLYLLTKRSLGNTAAIRSLITDCPGGYFLLF